MQQQRIVKLQSDEEFGVVAHVRGWCHNSETCPLCKAQQEAFEATQRLESVITG